MQEYSMYETLMNLPLFRGAGYELISQFVEKIHLDFKTYQVGETVVATGSTCKTICCLLSGAIEMVHPLFAGELVVKEKVGPGRFLGSERLFGMDNHIPFSATAIGRCGTMEISKSQYLNLLRSDSVYLINYLNYLSRSAQKFEDIFIQSKINSLRALLRAIVELTTNWQSTRVKVETMNIPILEFLQQVTPFASAELDELVDEGLVEAITPVEWIISDRNRVLEF